MRTLDLPLIVCTLSVAMSSCDADTASHAESINAADAGTHAHAGSYASPAEFPPPKAGYSRIAAPVMKGLAPGSDTMHCQYVQAPLDRDIDVLHVTGHQSIGGHHAVAYASTMDVPIGTSRPCNDDDNMAAGFLGGTGGEGGGAVELPDGIAFRLVKGSSIMFSTHFLNTTDQTIDGYSALDFQFVEADSTRTIASLFSNGNLRFSVAANAAAEAVAECVLPRDMKFILYTNHMHDQGTHAKTEVVRADGGVELVHEDPKWTYEMQFKAVYSQWPYAQPLTVAKGEVLRTHCYWQNTTAAELRYPREMCIGVGFFLSDRASAPVCVDGTWIER